MIDIMTLYFEWYTRLDVQFEMIKFLNKHETVFITKDLNISPVASRMHKINRTQHLQINLKCLPFRLQHPYNIYYSVAEYINGIPNQTLNFQKKKESQQNIDWLQGANIPQISNFPFFIDIDSPSHKDFNFARDSALELHYLFNRLNVPHEIRFSGMGFHFLVSTKDLNLSFNPYEENNIHSLFCKLAKFLYENISELIDLKVYDVRRVMKVPYSLSIYGNDAYLCFPILNILELKEMNIEDYKVNSSKDFKHIRGRGTFIFNQYGTIKNLINYVKNGSKKSK